MSINKKIETVSHYGGYSVTGPLVLPLRLDDGTVEEFTHEGFKFPGGRYSLVYRGNIKNSEGVLARISSNCQWAFYFESQLCDCKWQLEETKRRIVKEGRGLIIFAHDQHGKGISIEDHWKVYTEGQRRGLELVVDAYEQIGLREDCRDYSEVVDILQHYRVRSVRLLTNNPNRIKFFEGRGIGISAEGLEQPITEHLKQEYRSKKLKLNHLLKVPDSDLK